MNSQTLCARIASLSEDLLSQGYAIDLNPHVVQRRARFIETVMWEAEIRSGL